MAEKVDVPAEEVKETQEYIDEMSKKADDANNVATNETAPTPEPVKEELILGKFKSQDDLIKSYQELERKQSETPKEDNYLAGLDAVASKFEQQAFDSTGGEDNYTKMTDWITENLPEAEIQQFNDNIGKDNDTALFTIKGMYARYQSETKEPNLVTGNNAQQSGTAYESVGQMKADMADPRYATDSAFRKMVADKVSRSKVL